MKKVGSALKTSKSTAITVVQLLKLKVHQIITKRVDLVFIKKLGIYRQERLSTIKEIIKLNQLRQLLQLLQVQ